MNPAVGCSVIVPVYNSEGTLRELAARLAAVLPSVTQRHELLFVNDGSRDGSWGRVCDLAQTYPWVRGIDLMKNYGQHNALLCGIRSARGGLIITLDDDLQHPPEEIPKLIGKLSEGYDLIYGTPEAQRHGFWRGFASRLTKIGLQSALGAETARKVSAFRVFHASLREAFLDYNGPLPCMDVLLTWGARRVGSVTVRHDLRREGKSNYDVPKLIRHTLNMVTGFSLWPLRLASLLGFAFTFFGFLVLVYVIGRFFIEGGSIPGFPFLASIIALFSGVQLFTLGIIGEYLSRVHFRTMGRPTYVVRRHIGQAERQG